MLPAFCSIFGATLQAMRQLETDHRFKQAERARAEDIGLVSGSGCQNKGSVETVGIMLESSFECTR